MKPAPFNYRASTSIADAVSALTELGDEAKILAGGQSLVPMLALRLARPEHLIDVNRVADLAGAHRDNGHLVVGATTRHAVLGKDPTIGAAVPLLRLAAPYIGHFQIRSRGTLGGSLAHADAAAEWPAVVRALDAEIEVEGPGGTRTIPAAEFFETTFTTALAPDELLVAVRFPVWAPTAGFAVQEIARRHGDFAVAGAVCGVQVADGRVERVALALIGMGSVPERPTRVERELLGAQVAGLDLDGIGAAAVADLDPPSDVHGSGRYRKKVGAVLVGRALTTAIREATSA